MASADESHGIEWNALTEEFAAFSPDEEFESMDSGTFSGALVKPMPDFVELLLRKRSLKPNDEDRAVRDLYAFLLHKRYHERWNLLYFAFDVFYDSSLPESVMSATPFPHEDGWPSYRHRLDSSFKIL